MSQRLIQESIVDNLEPAKVERLRARAAEVATISGTLMDRLIATLAGALCSGLRSEMEQIPETSAETQAKILGAIDSWEGELRQLADSGTLRTAERWYKLRG